MEPGQPDVVEQLPVTGNPMEPTSGSYGRVAETDRLKQQLDLPGAPGPGGPGVQPTQGPPPGMPQGAQVPSAPGGVPDILMGPTQNPNTPPSTPLQAPFAGAPGAVNAAQRRLATLEALSQSDQVSDETREWAADVLQKLASRARQ